MLDPYAQPDYATDLRCPRNCLRGWLIEVAPEGLQCWRCAVDSGECRMYSNIERVGDLLSAVFVYKRTYYLSPYVMGEVSWRIDKYGRPERRAFEKVKVYELPPEELAMAPCPIVFPWDRPWPEALRLQLADWKPEYFAPDLYGLKEFSQ